jgi:hypothetical protein
MTWSGSMKAFMNTFAAEPRITSNSFAMNAAFPKSLTSDPGFYCKRARQYAVRGRSGGEANQGHLHAAATIAHRIVGAVVSPK